MLSNLIAIHEKPGSGRLSAPSCAAKIASSVEATIRNVGRLGRDGMRETDKEIVKIRMGGFSG